MMAMLQRLLLAFFIFLLQGCVSHTTYPDAFPNQKYFYDIEGKLEGYIESNLEGSFSCVGLIYDTNNNFKIQSLREFLELDQPWDKEPSRCSRVEVHRISGGLEIRYMRGDSLIEKQQYLKKRDYKIEDGWIKVKSFKINPCPDCYFFVDDLSPDLTVDTQGNLIINKNRKMGGIALVIPFYSRVNTWGMFMQINGPSAWGCEMSNAVNDAIYNARTATDKKGRPPHILDIVYLAEWASRPPVCNDIIAKYLADKAYRLALELSQ